MIIFLALVLVGGGCATTSSEVSKPHKPQMITGDEEREGMNLPDPIAGILSFLGRFAPGVR
jgi:hypothetical protein